MMKFDGVNACFTGIVSRYLMDGWHINAGTMDGSQGEMAKVDLTDSTRLVRVLMTKDMDARLFQNVIRVMVGYPNPKDNVPVDEQTYNTIWNSRLNVVEMHRFVEVRQGVFLEMDNDQIDRIRDIRNKRFARKYHVDSMLMTVEITNDEIRRIIAPVVRRRIGFKTVKPSDIETVIRNKRNGREQFDVLVRGKRVTI